MTAKERSAKKRRLFKGNKTTTVVVPRGPIAPRTIVRLKYHENFASDGTTFDYVWNLNSLFDPNRTGTGHQPYGYDQYTALYARYRVFKVYYTLITCTPTAGAVYQVSVGASNDSSTVTNASLAAESPNYVTKILSNAMPITFRGCWDLPRVNGTTAAVYKADDRFQANYNASPTEIICMHVVHSQTLSGGAPTANQVSHSLTLDFVCELFDPFTLGQS